MTASLPGVPGGGTEAGNSYCAECGMFVGSQAVYHPHLYCVLFKAGISKPEAYLVGTGWVRAERAAKGKP